jgi:hypothetical protein
VPQLLGTIPITFSILSFWARPPKILGASPRFTTRYLLSPERARGGGLGLPAQGRGWLHIASPVSRRALTGKTSIFFFQRFQGYCCAIPTGSVIFCRLPLLRICDPFGIENYVQSVIDPLRNEACEAVSLARAPRKKAHLALRSLWRRLGPVSSMAHAQCLTKTSSFRA